MQAARTLHWPNRSHSVPLLLKNSELNYIALHLQTLVDCDHFSSQLGASWMLHLAMPPSWSYQFMRCGAESYGWFSNLCLDQSCQTHCWFLAVRSLVGGSPVANPSRFSERCPVVLINSQVYMVQIDTEPLLHWQEDAVLNSGLLLMAVMGLVSPAMLYYTHTEVNLGKSALALSRFSSCIMLFAYAAFIFFELSNSRHRDESSEASRMSSFS